MRKSIKQYITSLGKWGFVVTTLLVGDLFGIVQSYVSSESSNFIFPLWGWWLILVGILVVSPFWAFHQMRLKKDELQNKLQKILNAKPRLVFRRIENRKDIHKAVQDGDEITIIGTPEFTRIWLANEPIQPEEGVDAELLHGEIEYYGQGNRTPLFTMGGRWPEQGQPAGSLLTQQLTIPPNRKEFCMDIGMKYPEDDEYYGYDDEAHLRPDGRNPRTRLGKGIYFVKVTLACKGLIQPIYFRLENKGKGHDVNFGVISESDFLM